MKSEKSFRKFVSAIAVVCMAACLFAGGAAEQMGAAGSVIRMASYHIRHCRGMDGRVDCARTAAAIRRERPDFAGIQEVDCRVRRTGRVDQAEDQARVTGMHATFAKAIPREGGARR
jgi:endonuclease/exonuclease/phosphatase family metal-dependent hydrolase